jgi:hypothetical protein
MEKLGSSFTGGFWPVLVHISLTKTASLPAFWGWF